MIGRTKFKLEYIHRSTRITSQPRFKKGVNRLPKYRYIYIYILSSEPLKSKSCRYGNNNFDATLLQSSFGLGFV